MTISRRTFIKGGASLAGIASVAALPAIPSIAETVESPTEGGPSFTRSKSQVVVTGRNGIIVTFVLDENRLKGIGSVSLNGKVLRNPSESIAPEICTPYAEETAYCELLDVKHEDGAVVISTRPYFRAIHRMEWTEHAMHPLVNTASWSKEPYSPEGSRLDWIVREVTETHDGVTFNGFSYGFRYEGPQHPIYQIEDKASWELGGDIVGNGFIMRGGGVSHARFTRDTVYYSGWYFPIIANPHVFQHKPLYTQMQGFTFQYDTQHVLLTVHERPSHVRALFQRESGQPALLHFNQFCFDLTTSTTTPARKVLVGERKPGAEAVLLNHYLRVRDELQEQNRKHYGLRYDKTRPSAHVETWAVPKLALFKPVFEQLKQWGINRTFIMPLWRSPETDINPRFKQDRERFGVFGNMCCPLELEIADAYGGWDGFKTLMRDAKELQLETYMWHATHFSSITPLLEKMPDLFCHDVNGQHNRNNYGHVLMAVNQRSKHYQEYSLERYRKAHECGLNGLFHDSHFNLATDTINFLHADDNDLVKPKPDNTYFRKPTDHKKTDHIVSMHDTSLELQRRLQIDVGMIYYVESEGALGTPMCGTDYENVRGNEFIYSNMDSGLDFDKAREFGDDVTMAYFRALSVRLMYQVEINPEKFPDAKAFSPWWNAETMPPLNRAFNKVEDRLGEIWVLEDDRGIIWKSPGGEVLFSYKDFAYDAKHPAQVLDAVIGKSYKTEGQLNAKRMGIYLLEPSS
jgi:hypothetical protein